ncbi:hypothetical protein VCHA53O466_40174 [Vibrio chagasii]|nr:hypothetical protein VCHA53O466_40174 [Vibrio chagasii]
MELKNISMKNLIYLLENDDELDYDRISQICTVLRDEKRIDPHDIRETLMSYVEAGLLESDVEEAVIEVANEIDEASNGYY